MTAEMDGDFVVFLIGMRINRLWKVHKWWPVMTAMPAMLKELAANPQSGFLSAQSWFGNPSIIVQYWRSFEALEAYAKNPNQVHLPAWKAFNQRAARNGDVGIWHETYLVRAGQYECIYNNLPVFGLGKAGRLVPATGKRETAAGRIGKESRSD